jgi:Ca-activated chloride channel family protein
MGMFLSLVVLLAAAVTACGSTNDTSAETASLDDQAADVSTDEASELVQAFEGESGSDVDSASEDGFGAAFEESSEAETDADSAFGGEATEDAMADADADAVDDDASSPSDRRTASTTTTSDGLFDDEPTEPNEAAQDLGFRSFVDTAEDPLSTFALDVDTGSYTLARRAITAGRQPDPFTVRPEEFVNSFSYSYEAPEDGLSVQADAGPSPFDEQNVVLRIGVQAERVAADARPDASLTFVVDTSGSMDRADRLGLVKSSLRRLVEGLDGDDTVAIVTYGDRAELVLEPTSIARQEVILDAIDDLQPTGSTNLEAGLNLGYELARSTLTTGGINRVVLASDGIANVGLTDPAGLSQMIRDDADAGIQLVTVGVGLDGFNDELMEQLADRGDGFYAYVDDLTEAERLFGDELVSTLLTIALDSKIQVEFSPDTVAAYRLIGFENRGVLDQDFRNDAVDAGELGAGHQVTALYELTLVDDLARFEPAEALGTVRLRWEDPERGAVNETSLPLTADVVTERWSQTSDDFRLAVTVATWAEVLRGSPFARDITTEQVWAEADELSPGNGPLQELADLIAQT